MKVFLIFIIFLVWTIQYKDSFISLINGVVTGFAFIYFLLSLPNCLKPDDGIDKTEVSKTRPKKIPKKKLSKYELELFAKQCNSALEYEDKKERWCSESKEQ